MIAPSLTHLAVFALAIVGVCTFTWWALCLAEKGFKWLCRLNADRSIGKQVRQRKLGYGGVVLDHEGIVSFRHEHGSVMIPTGTQTQRPSVHVQGLFRLNTTTKKPEMLIGQEWQSLMLEPKSKRKS